MGKSGAVDGVSGGAAGSLELDQGRLRNLFDREPFPIGHRLCGHPLLQLPRLIELARVLPEDSVEYNSGSLGKNQDPEKTPRTGLSVEETLRQIESCQSWMVLKYIENVGEYRELLDGCLNQVEKELGMPELGMRRRRAFVFVSSPGAVTPYHVDFEHNFLLQLRGTKYMTVWNGEDRVVMSELERERMATGGHRNLPYDDSFASRGSTFELRPGMGLHVPLSSPHCVKVGDEVSISLSITFLSAAGERLRTLHGANAYLRRHGIVPREVGANRLGDSVKFGMARVGGKLQQAWSKLRPGPGQRSA